MYYIYPCYGHFFVEYLCILENNIQQAHNEFSKFEHLTKQVCNVHIELFISNNNPVVGTINFSLQVDSLILNNINKYP